MTHARFFKENIRERYTGHGFNTSKYYIRIKECFRIKFFALMILVQAQNSLKYIQNEDLEIFFLKYLPWFKAWGPYDEMNDAQWQKVLDLLIKYSAKLTVGITASWVDKDGDLVPFPEKFPAQAHILKQGWKEGLLEIANHGLTHCVVGKHLPRLFSSNRKYHREFWDWVPREIHFDHLENPRPYFKSG